MLGVSGSVVFGSLTLVCGLQLALAVEEIILLL